MDGSELPAPIFTPALKAEVGEHDENVPYEEVGPPDRRGHRRAAAADHAGGLHAGPGTSPGSAGMILADTKFEFGLARTASWCSADEVLTPDSSRFWPTDQWEPGRAQPSFDKQFIRDWLSSPASGWDPKGEEPPPALPEEVVAQPGPLRRGLRAHHRADGLD